MALKFNNVLEHRSQSNNENSWWENQTLTSQRHQTCRMIFCCHELKVKVSFHYFFRINKIYSYFSIQVANGSHNRVVTSILFRNKYCTLENHPAGTWIIFCMWNHYRYRPFCRCNLRVKHHRLIRMTINMLITATMNKQILFILKYLIWKLYQTKKIFFSLFRRKGWDHFSGWLMFLGQL